MGKDLHKKLEEAFTEWLKEHRQETTIANYEDETLAHFCFKAGAEYGYKEAIAQAKEWLKEHFFYKHHLAEYYWESKCDDMEEALVDFETDMNKLLEK